MSGTGRGEFALKPCPLDGRQPRVSRKSGIHGTACKSRWMRETVACSCGLSITGKRPGAAVALWNRRTPTHGETHD